jgi:Zn-finger nucleic acid-binding protein
LVRADTSAATLFGCQSCGGVWVDPDACQRIYDAVPSDTLDAAGRTARDSHDVSTAPSIACPQCAAPLLRQRIQGAQIDIDTCATHGTWFDRDELTTVALAIAADRARAREAEEPFVRPSRESNAAESESRIGAIAKDAAADVTGELAVGILEASFEVLVRLITD